MIQKIINGNVTSFVYNTEDRLGQVWSGDAGTGDLIAEYYYDPFGRRLWKQVGATRTYYHYSDQGLIAEYDATGNEIKAYGWKPDAPWSTDPLFMKQAGQYYFYHNDHLGTPQKLTDLSGAVVWSAKYESFGKATVETGTVENNLRFPGQYYDSESGLHYNWHRYYIPLIGRYLIVDPIGRKGGVNYYLYAYANPITNKDVIGLLTCGSGWNEPYVPDNPFGFPFSDCCEEHDDCYGDCNASKDQCDDNFEECMINACAGEGPGRPIRQSVCRSWARRYAWWVRVAGDDAWDSAQSDCPCTIR